MLFDPKDVPSELMDCFEEVKVECGKPWCRVLDVTTASVKYQPGYAAETGTRKDGDRGTQWDDAERKTIGWRPTCKCPEQPPRPGLVLDPFSGSGRAGIQAGRMGLDFVGIELNPEYALMARELIREANPLFS